MWTWSPSSSWQMASWSNSLFTLVWRATWNSSRLKAVMCTRETKSPRSLRMRRRLLPQVRKIFSPLNLFEKCLEFVRDWWSWGCQASNTTCRSEIVTCESESKRLRISDKGAVVLKLDSPFFAVFMNVSYVLCCDFLYNMNSFLVIRMSYVFLSLRILINPPSFFTPCRSDGHVWKAKVQELPGVRPGLPWRWPSHMEGHAWLRPQNHHHECGVHPL